AGGPAPGALATYAWPEAAGGGVRMGLHPGAPARLAEGYVGLDLHYAARIMSAAYGGQVLLSQTTRDLVAQDVPPGVRLHDLGEHRLKDFEHPVPLYQVVCVDLPTNLTPPKTLGGRYGSLPVPPTALIGREHELMTLVQRLCREDVRLVTLTGSGGTGKTRLGIQVASELRELFAGGVCFVSLAPITEAALV